MEIRLATAADREVIYRMRHDVYACELGQHDASVTGGSISDELDASNEYIVAASAGGAVVGFVSITRPPGPFSIDRYLDRAGLPAACRIDANTYEVRLLTVPAAKRGGIIAFLLGYAMMERVAALGGTGSRVLIMALMPRMPLYAKLGFLDSGARVSKGRADFAIMHADLTDAYRSLAAMGGARRRLADRLASAVVWRLPDPRAIGAHHGGASVAAMGPRLEWLLRPAGAGALSSPHEMTVRGDVLDAWFPPAPDVLSALLRDPAFWVSASPPTDAWGVRQSVAQDAGLMPTCVFVGAGSSALIHRALGLLLPAGADVVLQSPTYSEYEHFCGGVKGCRVRSVPRVTADALRGAAVAVLVNPNNPSGEVLGRRQVLRLVDAHPQTLFWVDEAYIEYLGDAAERTLQHDAQTRPNLVVCRSLSKTKALSGVRAAYAVACDDIAARVRSATPPWELSAPAQIAAIAALTPASRRHYAAGLARTHRLRSDFALALRRELRPLPQLLDLRTSPANWINLSVRADIGDAAAAVAVEHVRAACEAEGVYLRQFALNGRPFLRATVRTPAENAALVQSISRGVKGAVAKGAVRGAVANRPAGGRCGIARPSPRP